MKNGERNGTSSRRLFRDVQSNRSKMNGRCEYRLSRRQKQRPEGNCLYTDAGHSMRSNKSAMRSDVELARRVKKHTVPTRFLATLTPTMDTSVYSNSSLSSLPAGMCTLRENVCLEDTR